MLKPSVQNTFVGIAILLASPWCEMAADYLWYPVFCYFLRFPFEVKTVLLAVPSALVFCCLGLLAAKLLSGQRKLLWLLPIAAIACVQQIKSRWMHPDASAYHRVFHKTVFAVTPWFMVVGMNVKERFVSRSRSRAG